jgi:two-component system, chemotaxis family, response regulator Rcp1
MSDRPMQILLVEDSPGDVVLTTRALEISGIQHDLHVVRDGAEALDFVHQRGTHDAATRPDLILLDLDLPKRPGHEVLGEIKAIESLRKIPVLILSGSQRDADVLEAYDLHANGFLGKPIEVEQFLRVVGDLDAFSMTIMKLPWHRGDTRD